MRSTLVLVTVLGTLAALASAAEYKVVWQFRQGSTNVVGAALQAALGSPTVEYGTAIRFEWGENVLHNVFKADSEAAYDTCSQSGQLVGPQQSTLKGNFTLQLDPGTHYFFDATSNNCNLLGLKMTITVLEAGVTIPPTAAITTPPPTLTETKTIDDAIVVTWHYGITQSDIQIQADDFLKFEWNQGVVIALREVSREAYESCDIGAAGTTHSSGSSSGEVVLSDLSVGWHYFISFLPTQCTSGGLKIAVNVVPADTVWWITAWPTEAAVDTDLPVTITLAGNDDQHRPWLSVPTQLNQQAVGGGATETLTLRSGWQSIFAVVARDVGTPTLVRLRRTSGEDWVAARLRVERRDGDQQSQLFECTPVGENPDGSTSNEQMCFQLVEPNILPPLINETAAPIPEECSCFRQFLHHPNMARVLSCTSDGCFATVDTATAGWSDMASIHKLLGVSSDDHIHAVNKLNQTVYSHDGGVTWTVEDPQNLPTLTITPVDYAINVTALSKTPRDEHVFLASDGQTEWGLTYQGIATNTNGLWELNAAWACRCDGACGRKCDQDHIF